MKESASVGLSSVRSNSRTTGPRRAGSAVVGSAVVGSAVAGSAVQISWFRRCFVFRRWFRGCFVFRRWYRWCNVNRIAFAIFWIALGSFVFARHGGLKKKLRILLVSVQSTLLLSFFCSTGDIQARTFIRRIHHNEDNTHFNCSRHN